MASGLMIRRAVAGGVLTAFLAGASVPPVAAQATARERTMFVSAVDRSGAPVEGLGAADFTIREDGIAREVLRVSPATEPLEIALLVDNSASSGELIPRVREGLKTFITELTPRHAVALITLADRPTVVVDYTTDTARLLEGTGRLFTQPRSGMTLLDAVFEVSRGMRRREAARAVIVPIATDGTDFSTRRYRDVLDALADGGAALYPVTVGTFAQTFDDVQRDRSLVLDAGPRASGGERFALLASTAIEGALARLARQLTSQYKVVYGRPETLIPPEKVVVGSNRAGLVVHGTPARVPAPGASR